MLDREQLKKNLPRGSAKKIAKKVGCSVLSVYRFLYGTVIDSPKIEKAALEIAVEHQQSMAGLRRQLISSIVL